MSAQDTILKPMTAPNLYQYFAVDPSENSTALGVQLAGRDARLAQQGLDESSQQRHEAMIAYSVLGDDTRRKLYDGALATGRQVTWAELDHLAAFSDWPPQYISWQDAQGAAVADTAQPTTAWPNAAQSQPGNIPSTYPHSAYEQDRRLSGAPSPFGRSFDPLVDPAANAPLPVFGYPTGVINYAEQALRPQASTRAWMALLDFFFVCVLTTMLTSPVKELLGDAESVFNTFIFGIVSVLYCIVPEVKWGGSPAKLIVGYEVRDAETHQRLTYKKSLKRNWFRAVNILPGVGPLIGFIGAAVAFSTVNPENGQRGSHDRRAGAEVVKRQRGGGGAA